MENKLTQIMMKARLFSGFSPADCVKLREAAKSERFTPRAGESFMDEGAHVDFFAILVKGRLLGERYHRGGAVELVQIYTAGDLIGLEAVCTPARLCPFQLRCATDADLLSFRYDDLMQTGGLPEPLRERLRLNIIHILANENIKKLHKIDVLYKRSLRDRIGVFLQNIRTRTGRDAFHIHMDREQFAQFLGVNRSALSHELSLLRQEGLIDFKKDYFELKQ
ncbi:MAG: Crp/Fnr family transcriptional regulator [Clostridiales Family XIII bacterium]|jgi:CRP-like cAMP-binding protein|nr:Crp/Fnr family transcriptional regulator [Clostridiales Family XIII bacterium]